MIIGIEGSFRLEMGWQFPTHKDFKLMSFSEAKNMSMEEYDNVDAFIQTNILGYHKNNMKEQHDFIDNTGKPRIVLEQATFRKNIDFDKPETYYYKVGLNCFTYDKGIFYNEKSPSDRWERIKKEQDIEIKPWRHMEYTGNEYILFLLQNPIDTSLNPLYERGEEYDLWINKTIKEIKKISNKKVRVRLHPRFQNRFDLHKLSLVADEISNEYDGWNKTNSGGSLYKDLKNAWACVTFSSNAATEAICEGIPVVNLDKSSFSWPVSYHTLDILKDNVIRCDFKRAQWLYNCAYTQWTMKEINSGIVHKRLLDGNRT
mgnify:FL=1|tara:strand:+ start:283 stop:1230 length:948 start_codon:yes stop_codon:yes gene_type:complete